MRAVIASFQILTSFISGWERVKHGGQRLQLVESLTSVFLVWTYPYLRFYDVLITLHATPPTSLLVAMANEL